MAVAPDNLDATVEQLKSIIAIPSFVSNGLNGPPLGLAL